MNCCSNEDTKAPTLPVVEIEGVSWWFEGASGVTGRSEGVSWWVEGASGVSEQSEGVSWWFDGVSGRSEGVSWWFDGVSGRGLRECAGGLRERVE